jgi:hypothetical protein
VGPNSVPVPLLEEMRYTPKKDEVHTEEGCYYGTARRQPSASQCAGIQKKLSLLTP